MNNYNIILNAALELVQQGKLSTTGRKISVTSITTGEAELIDEPEEIHTYEEWKRTGYQVQRGQKAVATIAIWRLRKSKADKDPTPAAPEGTVEISLAPKNFIKVNAAFFTRSQVESIAK